MKIIQIGFPRSGNYWLHEIIRLSLKHAGIAPKSFISQQSIFKVAKHWKLTHEKSTKIDTLDIQPLGLFYVMTPLKKLMPLSKNLI